MKLWKANLVRERAFSPRCAAIKALDSLLSLLFLSFHKVVFVNAAELTCLLGVSINWHDWLYNSKEACESHILYLVDEIDVLRQKPDHELWRAIKVMLSSTVSKAHVSPSLIFVAQFSHFSHPLSLRSFVLVFMDGPSKLDTPPPISHGRCNWVSMICSSMRQSVLFWQILLACIAKTLE
jgi:hypothetical protein